MVKFEVNFEKKHLYLVAALVVFLVGIGVVVAFGGTNPNIHGHSVEELEGVQRRVQSLCGEGSFIRDIDESGATICDADTDTQRSLSSISGRVVGGGGLTPDGFGRANCYRWGGATCTGRWSSVFTCPSGSSPQQIYSESSSCGDGETCTKTVELCLSS